MPGESHGQRSLAGYSPWGLKEADMTEWTNTFGAAQVTLMVKNLPSSARNLRDNSFDTWVRKIPWRRKWQPTPVFLPGESHGQRSLVSFSPDSPLQSPSHGVDLWWGRGPIDRYNCESRQLYQRSLEKQNQQDIYTERERERDLF